ncbi:MAG: hypothetical protein JJE51_15145 [Thermoanaerobaculia bacterium]|nr:hypothetical protein [Thermoanaerobaculia bacterium]
MKVRTLLSLTALVSSILGSIVVYLVLTVPNDLKADAMLKSARTEFSEGKIAKAHDSLTRIVQQYPRTDAAAAATVALVKIDEQERGKLANEIDRLRSAQSAQSKLITDLQNSVVEIKNTPPPKPAIVQAPAPEKPVVKKAPAKNPAPKRTTRRRR